jgi:anhydro-N-acetylmuramic acid kinase
MKAYRIIGVMSGSSMDGLDLAHCIFSEEPGGWKFEITHAETVPYDDAWKVRLSQLYRQPIHLYPKTDMFYGRYIGQCVRSFMEKNGLSADLVASHGHTIFHQPEAGFTAQVGNGAAIHAEAGVPVVSDFRTLDVALGGQGAPLVPIGDELLFGAYDACLNLGGFSNISYRKNGKRIAFDIGPCNIALNRVAEMTGREYDEDGKIAASGTIDQPLLGQLDVLPFFAVKGAKSLGREWVDSVFWPVVSAAGLTPEDMMATLSAHIAGQVAAAVKDAFTGNILVTGGGAFNTFLVNSMQGKVSNTLVIPGSDLIQYKEALIFAFLGLLRITGRHNALRSVTGARANSTGGALFGMVRLNA